MFNLDVSPGVAQRERAMPRLRLFGRAAAVPPLGLDQPQHRGKKAPPSAP